MIWLLLRLSRIYHQHQQVHTFHTVRLKLSRYDQPNYKSMLSFIHFLHRLLSPLYPFQYHYLGAQTLSWEIISENGQKNIYLSANRSLLEMILKNFQATYPHLRFEAVDRHMNMPTLLESTCLKERLISCFYPFDDQEYINEHSMIDHLLQSMDSHHGAIGIQLFITPYQKRKLFTRKKLVTPFASKIRLFATQKHELTGLVNILKKAVTPIPLRPINRIYAKLIKYIEHRWNLPIHLFGPKILFSAKQLAGFLQIPSSQLKTSGMARMSNQRYPVPALVPKEPEVKIPIFETEQGKRVGLTEQMLQDHVLFVGAPPYGKTKAVVSQAIPSFYRQDEPSVIIASTIEEAEHFLAFIPPTRKVYIMNMDDPGDWGINFLNNDQIAADIIAEQLGNILEDVYGDRIKNISYVKQAYMTLRLVRDCSPAWRKVIPSIDLRHIREILVNHQYRHEVIKALPRNSILFLYWSEQIHYFKNRRYYATTLMPVVDILNRILSIEPLTKTLCHPCTIDLEKALYDERAIVLLHGGNWDWRYDFYSFTFSMFITQIYQTLLYSKRMHSSGNKIMTNLFFDDFSGFAGRMMTLLCIHSLKLGVRIVAGAITYRDIHPNMHEIIDNLFANKVIFRTQSFEDAQRWSEQIKLFQYDDFLHLQPFHAAVSLQVNGQRVDPFLAKVLFYPELMKHLHLYTWPKAQDVQLPAIIYPDGKKIY
ncbi:hypothetical protein [Seinonella peptonophila]|uniref:hypothetical protein n=1 Tax=Seinonella peptonophila TaxID=112248 RepID=UPI001114D735|nr:hypothetical protein [Seinonella peptonophila]